MMAVRNEAWVLGLSVRVALEWCDHLVIREHASFDHSQDLLRSLQRQNKDRITLSCHPDPKWDEMAHRQDMLYEARSHGATHLAIIDADEILTGNVVRKMRAVVVSTNQHYAVPYHPDSPVSFVTTPIIELPGYNLRYGINRYHSNGIWGNRWFSVAFQNRADLNWSGDTFHSRAPQGRPPLAPVRPIPQGEGGIMHLWGMSERRLVAKHALYKMTETLRWPEKSMPEIDRMYSQAVFPKANLNFDQEWEFKDVPESWWAPYEHWLKYLDMTAVPTQEQDCQELVAIHGIDRFAGLDLFGVVKQK